MDLGILGGTFDPIHKGHIAIAQYAISKLNLEKVLFVPALRSPLKHRAGITSIESRTEMVKLALEGVKEFEISLVEIERQSPSFTVDTLVILKERLGKGTEFFVLLGWDSLVDIPKWKTPEKIIKLCKLVAVTRQTVERVDLTAIERAVPGIILQTIFLDMPAINISSTEIRERVVKGLSITALVPEKVARYIKEHRLYTKEA